MSLLYLCVKKRTFNKSNTQVPNFEELNDIVQVRMQHKIDAQDDELSHLPLQILYTYNYQ